MNGAEDRTCSSASPWRRYVDGIRATIDRAGRVVIPKPLRDQLGLSAGEVELIADGSGLRIEPVTGEGLLREGTFLVIPPEGSAVDDELVRTMRDADRR